MAKHVAFTEENILHKEEESGSQNSYLLFLSLVMQNHRQDFSKKIQKWMLQTFKNKTISEPPWETEYKKNYEEKDLLILSEKNSIMVTNTDKRVGKRRLKGDWL